MSNEPEVTGAVAWANPYGGYISNRYKESSATGLEKETFNIPLYPPSAIEGYAQELAKRLVREKLEEVDIKLKIADQMACAVGDLLDTKSLTPKMIERLRGVFHAYTY